MQQHRSTHAAYGAWTLEHARSAAVSDTQHSMRLVGSPTSPDPDVEQIAESMFEAGGTFVDALSRWLEQPRQREVLSTSVIDAATKTVEVAVAHFRELDLLAGEVAREAAAAGDVNPVQVEQVSMMAATLETYATRLRALLDPETVAVPEAEHRLQCALEASHHGGGLAALVAAL